MCILDSRKKIIMKNIVLSPIMKTNKFLTFFTVVFMAFVMTSCVQDDDFSVPQSLGNEENARLEQLLQNIESGSVSMITINQLKSLFTGQPIIIESEIAVKGYVSSSDATGNFYKEFYMQDDPENPTGGIGVMLNQVDSYNQFNQGREVYIYLKDLYLGENSSDVIAIGGQLDGQYLDDMTEAQARLHVLRSANTMALTPVALSPSGVNESHLGVFVTLESVQFPMAYAGNTFHNPLNDFDTRYPLVSCLDGSELQMETSSFASFWQEPIPTEGRGDISGVITQGFGGSPTVLVLNTTEDIHFDQQRCDPVFEESFSNSIDNTILDTPGWINYAEAGTALWMEDVYSGNGYARFSAFGTGESLNIGWLISPAIDLDAQDGEILTFQTEHSYPDPGHDPLEVLISTDFDGTEAGIATATWQSLTFDVSYIVDYNTWFNFTSSGPIDLSGYSGTAYIAFKYTGSDTANQNMNLDVDNIQISVE